MKEHTITQIAVIDESDPTKFQSRVNEELMAHVDVSSIEFHDHANSITAIITYTETLQEVESAYEYFAMQGKRYVCNDCGFCELDPDRRSATHYCRKHQDRVRLNATACEWFYQGLKAGELHLVTPEERRAQYERMDAEDLERRREHRKINLKNYRAREKLDKERKQASALPAPSEEEK